MTAQDVFSTGEATFAAIGAFVTLVAIVVFCMLIASRSGGPDGFA
jgi:hypothetical protein